MIASSPNRVFCDGRLTFVGLTKGYIAICDAEDFEMVSKFKWHAGPSRSMIYARHTVRGRANKEENTTTLLHRFVLGYKGNLFVDHIDGDTFNCQKNNLRICCNKKNLWGQGLSKNSTTGVKGVTLSQNRKGFVANIMKDRKNYYIGTFESIEGARLAYEKKAAELYGEFAKNGK